MIRCPGQDTAFWDSSAVYEVKCPKCGSEVEFFKDEPVRNCKKCGHEFVNPKMDFGCAAYCKYAEQCLGELSPELLAERDDLFKDRVAIEMKRYFGRDFKRIGHAMKVARHAQDIMKELDDLREQDGNPAVILSAAYLHDIGIKEAERKYGSNEARYQETEGPPVAREILSRLRAREELIEEVCDIIGHHHHPKEKETLNFKVLYDADLIVNIEENLKEHGIASEKVAALIEKAFFTDAGRSLARKIFAAA
ncbi:MAG: HD domain-containing protein [Chloroflexota bacterium]|jgi:HD superfamily phosphodiesterase/DNA-directed RNA polymerase subunit RPC12/RpoP